MAPDPDHLASADHDPGLSYAWASTHFVRLGRISACAGKVIDGNTLVKAQVGPKADCNWQEDH